MNQLNKMLKLMNRKSKNTIFSCLGILVTFMFVGHFLMIGRQIQRLRVLGLQDLPDIDPLGCFRTTPLLEVQAFICVKKNDKMVSQSIVEVGAWEPNNVQNLMKAMSFYDDAVFIDAGSNIGMYTIMVAAMGRRVVAVDAMADNLAFISRSLELADKTDKVVLVHNSISNTHQTLYPVPYDAEYTDAEENPGGNKVVDEEGLQNSNLMAIGPAVVSVTLQDIFSSVSSSTIILKIDIQGYECKALLTPGVFGPAHYIPYIFMEWSDIAGTLRSSICPDLDDLIDLLKHNGYSARDAMSLGKLPDSCLQSAVSDVLWVHKSARPIWSDDKVVECQFMSL